MDFDFSIESLDKVLKHPYIEVDAVQEVEGCFNRVRTFKIKEYEEQKYETL